MIFTSQIYRKTDPADLHPVVIYIDDIKAKFEFSTGTPCEMFQLRLKVQTDTDQDGTPDIADQPLGYVDVEKIFYANASQLTIADARFRGTGNLMAGIRAFCKARVDEHNTEVNPGGAAAVHTDIDTD